MSQSHIIDCDSAPYVPEGWEVFEHIKGGQLIWRLSEVELYLCRYQKTGKIEGWDLRRVLQGIPIMNANVLDYLLANQHLIPEEWSDKHLFFWGTIYRSSRGSRRKYHVRWLSRGVDKWAWCSDYLSSYYSARSPTVISRR